MKLPVILFTALAVSCSARAASILSKGSSPGSLNVDKQPRKLTLFVRTNHTGKSDIKQPLFGAGGSPIAVDSLLGDSRLSDGGAQPVGMMGQQPGGDCHPKCWWNCGTADCDEVCDPVCAPPQCETACGAINMASCRQVCQPPKCAIVCPTSHCSHGGCPGCKTVCAPPKCTTECAEQCESKCSEPQCTWKCNPGKCEKPRCTLTCGGAKACGLDGNLNARPPPFKNGMTVLAKALAESDPKVLADFAAKPPQGAAPMAGVGASPAPVASAPIR